MPTLRAGLAFIGLLSIVMVGRARDSLGDKHVEPPHRSTAGAASLVHLDHNSLSWRTTSTMSGSWYGIRQVPTEDMQTVANNLGGAIIGLSAGMQTAAQINWRLDLAQSLGYRAVVSMYTNTTCSERPWEWNGSDWVFPPATIDTLRGIAHHPALVAIYALHEPFDTTNPCHWTVEQQQELYWLLKGYTDGLPIWSDVGGLAVWEEGGIQLKEGICDYCGTFHHSFRSDWTSEHGLTETLSWIDADLDTQRRLMPNSQVVFQIQTFSQPGYTYPLRLPTTGELAIVRNHLCSLNQPMMYYPWSHDAYDSALKDAPQLWPVVAEGCAHYHVSDLHVVDAVSATSSLTITLCWTAPTLAVTYTLRSSDDWLTKANWGSAPTVTVPFTASPPGSIEWLTTSVNYAGGTLFLALKSQDSTGNWSELSNNTFWPHMDVFLPLTMKDAL